MLLIKACCNTNIIPISVQPIGPIKAIWGFEKVCSKTFSKRHITSQKLVSDYLSLFQLFFTAYLIEICGSTFDLGSRNINGTATFLCGFLNEQFVRIVTKWRKVRRNRSGFRSSQIKRYAWI